MPQDKEAMNVWSQAAPYWEKHRDTIRQMFNPITEALIQDAAIVRGHSVLDVATGPGEPALSIAEAVAAKGSVIGIDPAPEMIAAANRASLNNQRINARFELASADRLPFAAESFDAVVSRFGVMFFPSPVEGVREMLRVLRPQHKLAFAVWYLAEKNPFHYIFSSVIERYVPAEPVVPDSPDAFRFAGQGKLLNILKEAGATALSERLLRFTIDAPLSVENFWTLRSEMSDKLRKKLSMLSAHKLAQVRDEVIRDLRHHSSDRGISLPAEVLIVSGAKRGEI